MAGSASYLSVSGGDSIDSAHGSASSSSGTRRRTLRPRLILGRAWGWWLWCVSLRRVVCAGSFSVFFSFLRKSSVFFVSWG